MLQLILPTQVHAEVLTKALAILEADQDDTEELDAEAAETGEPVCYTALERKAAAELVGAMAFWKAAPAMPPSARMRAALTTGALLGV